MIGVKNKSKNKKVPELRFPGFSGEWGIEELKDVFEKKSERNLKNKYSNVLTNSATKGIVGQSDYFKKDIANRNNLKNYFIVELDDFVYNPRISKRAPVGPLKRNKLEKGIMSPLYTVLKLKKGNLSFYEYYFDTKKWHHYMNKIANYGARHDRMNILSSDFFKMPLPYPKTREQSKIASSIEKVNKWIDNLQLQKEFLENYKKGIMQKIFSREIRFKDDDGKDFPEWEEEGLGEIGEFLKGRGISKSDIVMDGKNKCIRYGELYTEYGEIIHHVKSSTNLSKAKAIIGNVNDLLIPSSGEDPLDIAKISCLKKENALIGGDINIFRPNEKIDGSFLAYYLSNKKKKSIAKLAQGYSIVHLYSEGLRNLSINMPILQEQERITDFLNSLDKLTDIKKKQLSSAEKWKKGLMQKLFI